MNHSLRLTRPRQIHPALWSLVLVLASPPLGAASVRPTPLTKLVRGRKGPPTVLLLHGYGATAADWEPFTHTIAVPPSSRFVFPQAPETTVPPDGPVGGRAWWRLDLEGHLGSGSRLPDLSTTRPPGLTAAATRVRAILRGVSRSPGGPIVLGGFSQGAMVASQIAFTTDEPIAALVLLSGTPVDEQTWLQGLAVRRGLPVFMSHGRADNILPFASDERFHRELEAAGVKVTWFPFDGGHEVPKQVVDALNVFLSSVPLGR